MSDVKTFELNIDSFELMLAELRIENNALERQQANKTRFETLPEYRDFMRSLISEFEALEKRNAQLKGM